MCPQHLPGLAGVHTHPVGQEEQVGDGKRALDREATTMSLTAILTGVPTPMGACDVSHHSFV